MEFQYTEAQKQALRLLGGSAGNIMLFGGSRSGKTFIICSGIMLAAIRFPGLRIAILRRYQKDVRQSILMDTFPKVLDLRFGIGRDEFEKRLCRTENYFRTQAGSEVWFCGLDESGRAEKILGREYGLLYFNEVSQIPSSSVEIAKTRLAMKVPKWRNRCFYDCNPTPKNHWVYRTFIEKLAEDRTPLLFPDDYISYKMNPEQNRENISSTYLEKTLGAMTGNVRKRFLLGDWIDEHEGSLWKQASMIDPYRLSVIPVDLERIVVAVDPAVTSGPNSDHTGIIVAGKKMINDIGHYYVLDDKSMVASPVQWARQVVAVFEKHRANHVVAEVNQGGDLVVSVLRNIDVALPVRTVHAGRGKYRRAEPIAALYEQGLVHHVGRFDQLEDEMCSYTGTDSEKSPDRMDALVWALTDLLRNSSLDIGSFRFV